MKLIFVQWYKFGLLQDQKNISRLSILEVFFMIATTKYKTSEAIIEDNA